MEYLEEFGEKLNKITGELKEELAGIRTNRPTTKLIENIITDYAGQPIQIKQLGTIGIELPRNLLVTPWDKNAIPIIIKAVENANIGVSVSSQENIVRISLPELTDERREELIKLVKNAVEKSRIKMRTLRDDVHKLATNENDEDEKFRKKEELQSIVDSFNREVDGVLKTKIDEINN